MARELPYLRDEVALIKQHFPTKGILTLSDIAEYTGKSRNWCMNHGLTKNMTISQLAYELTQINKRIPKY